MEILHSIKKVIQRDPQVGSKPTLEASSPKNSEIAAKKLSSPHDLDLYFKKRPNVSFCNHAVAVVAATAAVVAAASSVIEASKRGRVLDGSFPINLPVDQASGLNVKELMKIRRIGL